MGDDARVSCPDAYSADQAAAGAEQQPGRADQARLQIGDVAERTGLSLRTIRYYEEVGLLPPSRRSPGGFRLYTQGAVDRLLLIKQTKLLKFTIEQLREVLHVLDELDGGVTAPELVEILAGYEQLAAERLEKLHERLAAAEAFRGGLARRLALPPVPTHP